jgi:hypothetical protein
MEVKSTRARARATQREREREKGGQGGREGENERASKKRAHEIGYFNPSLGNFFVRTSSLPLPLPFPPSPRLLSPPRPACYPAPAFLEGELN